MIYGFDTKHQEAALGALIVYGMYRSRDMRRFKIRPDMWTTISNAVGGCALRAVDLWDFIEKLKPKLCVGELRPKWMAVEDNPILTFTRRVDPGTGEIIERNIDQQANRRQFWVDIIDSANHETTLRMLSHRTSYIIALVRDRLERERPYEAELEEEDVIDAEYTA